MTSVTPIDFVQHQTIIGFLLDRRQETDACANRGNPTRVN